MGTLCWYILLWSVGVPVRYTPSRPGRGRLPTTGRGWWSVHSFCPTSSKVEGRKFNGVDYGLLRLCAGVIRDEFNVQTFFLFTTTVKFGDSK